MGCHCTSGNCGGRVVLSQPTLGPPELSLSDNPLLKKARLRNFIMAIGLSFLTGCAHPVPPDKGAEAYRAQMDQLALTCLQSLQQEMVTPENANAVMACMQTHYWEDKAHMDAVRQHRALIRAAISSASRSRLPDRNTAVCSSGPLNTVEC